MNSLRTLVLISTFFSLIFALFNPGVCATVPGEFEPALPGYHYSFPADHATHERYKTEWWYYTGHLQSKDGKRFGFELTFFRIGNRIGEKSPKPWSVSNVYLAHAALTDIDGKQFHFAEQSNRAAFGQAGADSNRYHVWNRNWAVTLEKGAHTLRAMTPEFALDLVATPSKPPAVHGQDGVSQKADCRGCASHYYSLTRMEVAGRVRSGTTWTPVTGLAWMDHEFGSNQLTKDQIGWDWYSIQLNNNTELMAYVMRLKDGSIDHNSSASIVLPDGSVKHLGLSEFHTSELSTWRSPHTKAIYPSGWRLLVPAQQIDLTVQPLLKDQELVTNSSTGVSYWEGACTVEGHYGPSAISGQAYVELTGYAGSMNNRI